MKNKNVIVRLVGGLGNQMFIYAFGKFLQQQGYTVRFDTNAYDKQIGGGIIQLLCLVYEILDSGISVLIRHSF